MGFFDMSVTHKCKSQKEVIVLKEKVKSIIKHNGFEETTIDNQTFIENYSAPKALLKYNLSFHEEKNDLIIQGELQQTLLLAILIIFAILLTYGIGVILVVGYAYYQRIFTSKVLKQLIKESEGTQLA